MGRGTKGRWSAKAHSVKEYKLKDKFWRNGEPVARLQMTLGSLACLTSAPSPPFSLDVFPPLELTEHDHFYNEGPGLQLMFSHQAVVKSLEIGRLHTSWSSNTGHFSPSGPVSLRHMETSVAGRESEQDRLVEAKSGDLHFSLNPMTGLIYKPARHPYPNNTSDFCQWIRK